jgi:multidrug efflux pump subunit AcrA (membrane-fusion protein)
VKKFNAAGRSVMVSTAQPGVVDRVHFESGQTVRAGDVLIELDSGDGQTVEAGAASAITPIRSPFSGSLGIRLVDVGQTVAAGDPIVAVQVLDWPPRSQP